MATNRRCGLRASSQICATSVSLPKKTAASSGKSQSSGRDSRVEERNLILGFALRCGFINCSEIHEKTESWTEPRWINLNSCSFPIFIDADLEAVFKFNMNWFWLPSTQSSWSRDKCSREAEQPASPSLSRCACVLMFWFINLHGSFSSYFLRQKCAQKRKLKFFSLKIQWSWKQHQCTHIDCLLLLLYRLRRQP